MVNDAMDGISRKISGNFVKNGCEFKNVIADMNNIFDDGESIWHFDEKRIETSSGEKLYQINAVNVTTEIKLSSEIMEDNERLRELNEKLKEYSRDIDHTVKEEELLGAKVKIHDEFGRVLLLARAVLSGNEETIKTDELIRNWKNTVALFGSGAMSSDRNSDNPVSGIMDAANFLGVEIEFKGDISDNVTFKNLLYAGARECLTNLVKHAHGNRLVITVSEAEFYTRISFENNGEPPKGEIRYGGGLTSLSKICDRSRASMHVECDNVFRVVIEIPKLGGNA